MAARNRKNKSSDSSDPKKKMSRSEKDFTNSSLAENRFAGLLGIIILFFAIVYAIVMGSYIYKRGTGKTTSALKHDGPFSGNGVNMGSLRNPVPTDDSDKRAFSEENVENLKEVYIDVNGNAQVPPNGEEENVNENSQKKSNEDLKQRHKRSVSMESGNLPDETGEMSDYLRNILTRGPSANFVDLLRNKIVILNPFNDDSVIQPTSFTTTHMRHRRSINQHMFASGIKNSNVCYNINTIETDICY